MRPAKEDLLQRFEDFCVVDRRLTESTARVHQYDVDRFAVAKNWKARSVRRGTGRLEHATQAICSLA